MSIKKSFSSRLSLYILIVSSGLLIVLTVWLGSIAISILRKSAREKAELTLSNAIVEVEKVITEVERAVDNVDWMVYQHLDDEEFMYQVTQELVKANPNIIGSAVAFEPGFYKGRHYFAPYSYIGDLTHELHSMQMGNENYD